MPKFTKEEDPLSSKDLEVKDPMREETCCLIQVEHVLWPHTSTFCSQALVRKHSPNANPWPQLKQHSILEMLAQAIAEEHEETRTRCCEGNLIELSQQVFPTGHTCDLTASSGQAQTCCRHSTENCINVNLPYDGNRRPKCTWLQQLE